MIQKTENGFHVYTDLKLKFSQMCNALRWLKADISWIKIGEKRGYWFLADKDAVIVSWPVERMALHYDSTAQKNSI